mmetsp:Transcript_5088/g.7555  ORF Transcript_5088/g.7555 Transcript_5088/m.7555 type:complete len:211 (-) Transcript_5088:49-681(-)
MNSVSNNTFPYIQYKLLYLSFKKDDTNDEMDMFNCSSLKCLSFRPLDTPLSIFVFDSLFSIKSCSSLLSLVSNWKSSSSSSLNSYFSTFSSLFSECCPSSLVDFLKVTFPQFKDFNSLLRFNRYLPSQSTTIHCDRPFSSSSFFTSHTILLFLNDSNGVLEFFQPKSCGNIKIIPKTGTVVIFPHHCWHQGHSPSSSTKYSLRSDLLFSI